MGKEKVEAMFIFQTLFYFEGYVETFQNVSSATGTEIFYDYYALYFAY